MWRQKQILFVFNFYNIYDFATYQTDTKINFEYAILLCWN